MKDGGPAFPVIFDKADRIGVYSDAQGLTKREWFAAAALPYTWHLVLKDRLYGGKPYTAQDVAEIAFNIADAMIVEAEKGAPDA